MKQPGSPTEELALLSFYTDEGGILAFSHWSVVVVDTNGDHYDVATGVMHDTPLQAWRELRAIEQGAKPYD